MSHLDIFVIFVLTISCGIKTMWSGPWELFSFSIILEHLTISRLIGLTRRAPELWDCYPHSLGQIRYWSYKSYGTSTRQLDKLSVSPRTFSPLTDSKGQSRSNIECRHCNSGDAESQAHLAKCSGTIDERRGLRDLEKGSGKLIFW